jgi:hypothetical protein
VPIELFEYGFNSPYRNPGNLFIGQRLRVSGKTTNEDHHRDADSEYKAGEDCQADAGRIQMATICAAPIRQLSAMLHAREAMVELSETQRPNTRSFLIFRVFFDLRRHGRGRRA